VGVVFGAEDIPYFAGKPLAHGRGVVSPGTCPWPSSFFGCSFAVRLAYPKPPQAPAGNAR
jgi:hypothetical protein